MKKAASLIIFVLTIFVITLSCKISYPVKFLDLNEKIIKERTRWVLRLEDKSGFLIKGENLSQDTLIINHGNKTSIVPPRDLFNISIEQASQAEILNRTYHDITIRIKINYYKTNLIQEVYETTN
ncbi:hypothetical protein DU508_17550 [Pedobacter chinensis]|uniref:Uncharacterized protein n=1 Tax=Pedobacter chinensis TaxID=2282421 RepID=A0A369PZ69_9SPHI|nr:hypothetical protein [Pedobacter chinensis]RDC55378.1 hypothetical protein DU508_17550 [Pedobacter chinensis]